MAASKRSPAPAGARPLVIVESPAKAKTIAGFLGGDYTVESSIGHIRDLPRTAADVPASHKGEPWAKLGVDVDHGFTPLYIVADEKKAQVAKLRALVKDASELYLATDEDREGESIAWHLLEVLKPKVPVKRMVFHEITRAAIQHAVDNSRDLDRHLVDAQEARRILDRLYGYEVSPVLWKKINPGLSAGRVQSVATRLVVERERARMRFHTAGYWDIAAQFAAKDGVSGGDSREFDATLVALDGQRLATGKDFGEDGLLKAPNQVVALDEARARLVAERVHGGEFNVRSVEEKPYKRSPYAPFMTSTLQQEAGRKLRFSSQRAMSIAQRLYENGYITYMRTDSTNLSETAVAAARSQVRELYGAEYVPAAPRVYSKKVKNAQEAHEAIRPAGETFRTPGEVRSQLNTDEFNMYEMIWMRTIASQMADARGTSASARIGVTAGGFDAEFAASGKVITFPGFLRAYVEGSDDPDAELEDREVRLPPLVAGSQVDERSLEAQGHNTQPPARYTEASLVKALEELGVGRPSTYASIITTIQNRGYVWKKGSALVPSFVAFAVVGLLERHFTDLVDFAFTAKMEDDLDAIASGQGESVPWLTRFYFGENGNGSGTTANAPVGSVPPVGGVGLKAMVGERVADIDAAEINTIVIGVDPEGREVVVKPGRYGPYVKRGDDTASVPEDLAPDELTVARAAELLAAPKGDRVVGADPASGLPIFAKAGRFGPYVQLGDPETIAASLGLLDPGEAEVVPLDADGDSEGTTKKKVKRKKKVEIPKPKTSSLFKTMAVDTVTLEEALALLSLPRVVGADPANNDEIVASNGKFGPYLKKGSDSRSITSEEQLLTITVEEALAIYAQPKTYGRRGAAAPKPPLAELGIDPASEKLIVMKEGRFGPYVTDGITNASLRRGDDPETITNDRAVELLAERRIKDETMPKTVIKRGSPKKAAGAAKKKK